LRQPQVGPESRGHARLAAVIASIKGLLRRTGIIDRHTLKGFLRDVSGVIHVGAHTGQERQLYAQYGLRVLWIEPLGELFAELERNIADLPEQRAVRALVTDEDGAEYAFNVASNAGGSSSILPLKLHADIWPEVTFTRTIALRGTTLPTLLQTAGIDSRAYDALVMDTQGSELLVLRGAAALLSQLKYIRTEVADFEAYEGCCQLADIESFLAAHGFRERIRKVIARHPTGGGYYDIVYERRTP
jgi:FkbM family methyltransferase